MLQKRKINMDTVIVSYKIIVNADVAKKYGLTIEINSERSN